MAVPVHANAPWAASICELKFASVRDGNTPPDRIACPRSTALVLANGEYEYSTEQGPGSRKGRRLPPIFGTPAQEPYRNGRLLGPWTKLVLGQKGGLATRQGEDRKGEAHVRLARISSSHLHVYLLGSVEQARPDY